MDSASHRHRLRSAPRSATVPIRGRVDGFSPILRSLHVPDRTRRPPDPLEQKDTPKSYSYSAPPSPPFQPAMIPAGHTIARQVKSETTVNQPSPQKPRKPFTNSQPLIGARPQFTIKRPLLSRILSGRLLTMGLTICLLIFSGYVSFDALWINHQAKAAQITQQQANDEGTSSNIDESPLPPDSIKNYSVAPSLPRVIRIDDIGVEARILRMGVTADNIIDTPKNSNDAGWYDGSSKPGEAGAMIVNGHYSGLTKPGIFHGLEKLKTGAVISVEKGDGKTLRYAVEKIEKLPVDKVQMDQLFVSRKPNAQSLNLITCSGNFDAKSQTYDQRVIVYASAIQ